MTESKALWALPFSLPYGSVDQRVFEVVVGTDGREVAKWLLASHQRAICDSSSGLFEFISAWIDGQEIPMAAWDVSFGQLRQVMVSGGEGSAAAAARLGVRLAECGQPGDWQATFQPTAMKVGPLVTSDVKAVSVSSDGEIPRIALETNHSERVHVVYDPSSGRWQYDPPLSGPPESNGISQNVKLVDRSTIGAWGGAKSFDDVCIADVIDDRSRSIIRAGIQIHGDSSTGYSRWIDRVLRAIVLCESEADFRVISGSGEALPGVVHVSSPPTRMDVAEILVHECAHQYFYMLQRVGPVDDGSDSALYWSPPIRKHRPLSRVLMAYHALANVLIFYAAMAASSAADIAQYVRANEAGMRDAVRALDEPLRANNALTPLGRALYEPLAAELSHLA